jgi:hypothetical protein
MRIFLGKRKNATTGLSLEAQLQAWTMYFTTGYDFFHDLAVLGIARTHDGGKQAPGDAWQRLGHAFMSTW